MGNMKYTLTMSNGVNSNMRNDTEFKVFVVYKDLPNSKQILGKFNTREEALDFQGEELGKITPREKQERYRRILIEESNK